MDTLKEREQTLIAVNKVTENSVDQLKGALAEIRTAMQTARADLSRVQRNLGSLVFYFCEETRCYPNVI